MSHFRVLAVNFSSERWSFYVRFARYMAAEFRQVLPLIEDRKRLTVSMIEGDWSLVLL